MKFGVITTSMYSEPAYVDNGRGNTGKVTMPALLPFRNWPIKIFPWGGSLDVNGSL